MTHIPKQGSLRETICLFLHRSGAKPVKDIHHALNRLSRQAIDAALYELRKAEVLSHADKKYDLTPALRDHYDTTAADQKEVELSIAGSFNSVFRPWTGKFDPLNAYRREPIRDMTFKTAGAPALSFVQPV